MTVQHIDIQKLEAMLQSTPQLKVVDVRSPQEYLYLGHIPQAILLPLNELPERYRELNPQDTIALICQHGIRSLEAATFLKSQGYPNIINVQDGMSAWEGDTELGTP